MRRCNERIKLYRSKYDEISDIAGIAKEKRRMSVTKSEKVLTSGGISGTIPQADIQIGKSLGAASFRDNVLLPNGKRGKIAEGSKITKVVTFAGKGTGKAVKIASQLSNSKEFRHLNISPGEWKKREVTDMLSATMG